MKNAPARQRLELGFTMVSVLVAIVLLAIGAVTLSTVTTFLVSVETDAAERSTATSIGAAYMEDVKARPRHTLASEPPTAVNSEGLEDPGGAFVRTLTVATEPSVTDAKRITVAVRYPRGFGRFGNVEVVTVVYQGS